MVKVLFFGGFGGNVVVMVGLLVAVMMVAVVECCVCIGVGD